MKHVRIPQLAPAAERGRYAGRRRFSPASLALVLLLHGAVLGAALTYRFTVAKPVEHELVVVDLLDAEPPPPNAPEPEKPVTDPPPAVIHVPPPIVAVPVETPPTVAVTPEPPPPDPPVATAAAPAPGPVVRAPAPQTVAAGDLSSSMIHAPPPRYPYESRRKREQGTVLLSVLLGEDGRVAAISVARSSGHPRLDEAALGAVRRWRWSPTVRDGKPARVRGTVEIPFVLTG